MNLLSLEQELTSALNSDSTLHSLRDESYEYKSLFLNRVFPDETNPRFFPAILISDEHAEQLIAKRITKRQLSKIYNAENKVMIGKACIINCCKYDSIEWKKVNKTMGSVIELGENLLVSEIIQAPTVFPIGDNCYQISTGHRRFFALVYANGASSAAHFKVYQSKPVLQKTKQFQENASREDLPQYGKLIAFQDAMLEMDALKSAQKKLGVKSLTVREKAATLGISMGAFDNYNVLSRYPAVIDAYERGNTLSFLKMKKMVTSIEKRELDGLRKVNINDKRKINKMLEQELSGTGLRKEKQRAGTASSKGLSFRYNSASPHAGRAFKMILSEDITKLDFGINFEEVDWENAGAVNDVFQKVMENLELREL